MTQEQAIAIAMGVAAVVFIIAIIVNVKLTHLSWRIRFREKAKAHGCVTTGYFDKRRQRYSVEEINGNDYYHYTVTIRYKYTVDGAEYYTKVKYSHPNENKDAYLDDPMQVTVYYDKQNPKKAYAASKVSDSAARQDGVALIWAVTLAAGVAAYFLLHALFL